MAGGSSPNDSLIKLARSLDQSSAESVPDTLCKLWKLLSSSISSSFHAPEELVLRWLLKNMNGTTETAEQFRRHPLTWRIISCVFTRIPLISLAKSLADRRFIPILQQTLTEISKPQNETSTTDMEMTDTDLGASMASRKRKRTFEYQNNIENLRSAPGCLVTAESLLGAIKTLLQTLDPIEENMPSSSRMGAEHVKSLFCSSAKDAADLLHPILSICDIVIEEQAQEEPLEDQHSWVAIFNDLWNFHLQSNGDAVEVATSLFPIACIVMAKMDRSKDLALDPQVKLRWSRDLRRFFIKNMILPARAAFLNRQDIGIFQIAVDVTNFMPTASCPVLFNLAAKVPYSPEDAVAKKSHEDWTRKVFDVIEEPMRTADSVKRNQAMRVVLETAIDTKASISLSSLRTVCRQHKGASDNMDLDLLERVATLDVDAFLISSEGHALLDSLFEQINNLNDANFVELGDTNPSNLIQLLAKGFAKGRDFVGFLKRWFNSLAECFKKGEAFSSVQNTWSSQKVIETVSSLLQASVNTRQLLVLVDWLETQKTKLNAGALLVVLDALSQGINEEEYIDAVDTRLYDIIAQLKFKSLEDSSKARWWRIVHNTVSWSPLDRINTIWTSVSSDLKKALDKGDPRESATMAAFHCSNRFWLANFRGGRYESDAAALTCSFSKRLQFSEDLGAARDLLMPLALSNSPRVAGFAANIARMDGPIMDSWDRGSPGMLNLAVHATVQNENVVNGRHYGTDLVNHAIQVLVKAKKSGWTLDRLAIGLQTLLEAPSEAFTRLQREQLIPLLLRFIASVHDEMKDIRSEKTQRQALTLLAQLLSLMIKMMSTRTTYEGMNFADLVAVGDAVLANLKDFRGGEGDAKAESSFAYSVLYSYEELAFITLKQMSTYWESKEAKYFTEAFKIISAWSDQVFEDSDGKIHHLILLTSMTRAMESSKNGTRIQEVVDSATVQRTTSLHLANFLSAVEAKELHAGKEWNTELETFGIFLVAWEHTDAADPKIIGDRFASSESREELELLCKTLCERGFRAGWRLKELIFLCFGETGQEPLKIDTGNTIFTSAGVARTPLCARADIHDVKKYIRTVLKSMDEAGRDTYVLDIRQKIQSDSNVVGILLTLHQLLGEENDPSFRSCVGKLDLAEVHSVLASRLVATNDATEFALISQTLCTLLDRKASSMKQWNTELTLSVVSTLCSVNSNMPNDIKSSSKTYGRLCRLVEVVIKRHRLRLEGHFHLLIPTLQALLHLLIARPPKTTTDTTTDDFSLHESQAKLFSRLLTLVCEPSVASVTRGQPTGLLDSATDAAKRSAGQHMYLILIAYLKLQLEHVAPRVVREALQPGMYSILDITTQEGRRILNEALDGSGRAIFRDMYKRYIRFGKWSGI